MIKFRPYWLLAVMVTCFLAACVPSRVTISCEQPTIAASSSSSVAINLYVDGTPSMKGFVSNPNSRYVQTLERLLSVSDIEPVTFEAQTKSFSRDTQFFRLGNNQKTSKKVEPIDRQKYRQAQIPAFYGGVGFPSLTVSHIDAAIVPNEDELTVIVTDLYQAEDDASAIVKQIKQYMASTNQSGAVGVIGIKSEFNGTVYTEAQSGGGSFDWNKPHPFYLLVLGQLDDVHFYTNRLMSSLDFSEDIQATIFSPYRLYGSIAHLEQKQDSELSPDERKSISIPKSIMKQGTLAVTLQGKDIQPLVIRDKKQPVDLPFTVMLKPIEHLLETDSAALTTSVMLETYDSGSRKFVENASSPAKDGLSLKDLQIDGNTLSFSTQIQPESIRAPGIYSFKVDTTVNAAGDALGEQSWWDEWNSSPASQEGSKTHDLENFLQDLRSMTASLMRQNAPLVGHFCYVIQKN
jgi:hypothetical protein